jgi:hypothetical protein
MSKTAEFGKKTQGILGVNSHTTIKVESVVLFAKIQNTKNHLG